MVRPLRSFELGGDAKGKASWVVNISNGAGENGREDAGQDKDEFVNNKGAGKRRVALASRP